MAKTIQNLEIFGAGTHSASTGRVTITEADLDKIVENFGNLQGSNVVKPHLKLGHTESQKWFGQENGIPTLGWITKVWRAGSKLLANVDGVPDALIDMFRQGRYHNVSAEVYLDPIEVDGKKVAPVLSAVAILGTEMPAVKDLAGLANALFATSFEDKVDIDPVSFTQERKMPDDPKPGLAIFAQDQVNSLIAAAVAQAVAEFKAKTEAEVKDFKIQMEVLTKRAETSEAAAKKFQEDAAKAEATRIVDDAIKAGKLLPKQRDFALAFMSANGAVKFGEGEKSTTVLFKEFLEAAGKQVTLDEKGGGKNGEHANWDNPAQEVDVKARKLMASDGTGKLTYTLAMDKVLSDDPDLKARYAGLESDAA